MRTRRSVEDRTAKSTFRILAFPAQKTGNPHVRAVYRCMEALESDIEIIEFDVRRRWVDVPDVVHIHWPERASEPERLIAATSKSALMILHLLIWRLRGVPVVWTVHNLRSHEQRHPRLERAVKALMISMCRGSIHLSRLGRDEALECYPSLRRWPTPVIPLPMLSRLTSPGTRAYRSTNDADERPIRLVSFGRIRAYKNTPRLVEAFAELGPDHPSHLIIAGKPDDAEIGAALRAHEGNPRIDLELRWFEDDEMERIIKSADVAVLPYLSFLNSGVVIDALAFGVPAAVTRSPATEELAEMMGDEWVLLLPRELTSDVVAHVIDWAKRPRRTLPNLLDHELETVTGRTLDLLREAAGQCGPTTTGPSQ